MQGDIFQLDILQSRDFKSRTSNSNTTPTKHQEPTAAQVSIYNEDDLSQFLYQPTRSFHGIEHHRHLTLTDDHAPYLDLVASAFPGYCSDTRYDSSDDCAVFSDDEDEVQTPVEDSLPRFNTSVNVMDAAVARSQELGSDVDKTICHEQQTQNSGEDRTIQSNQHVSSIEGHMMSWWPLPLEMEQYDWDDGKDDIESRLSRQESTSEKKMMNWWPLPVNAMEYDWNEKFYE